MSKADKRKKWTLADLQALPGVRGLNPHLFAPGLSPETPVSLSSPPPVPSEGKKGIRVAPEPKTRPEREMAAMLRREENLGEVLRWQFEGVTLQAGGARYTPDFAVWRKGSIFVLIEVKGPYIRDDALVKFKLMAGMYPSGWAKFEMWQLTKEGWAHIA